MLVHAGFRRVHLYDAASSILLRCWARAWRIGPSRSPRCCASEPPRRATSYVARAKSRSATTRSRTTGSCASRARDGKLALPLRRARMTAASIPQAVPPAPETAAGASGTGASASGRHRLLVATPARAGRRADDYLIEVGGSLGSTRAAAAPPAAHARCSACRWSRAWSSRRLHPHPSARFNRCKTSCAPRRTSP